MPRWSLSVSILLAVLAAAWAPCARAQSPLTADMMTVVLRPELPGDRNYVTYVATLLQQGQLPRELVESTLLWARRKMHHRYRYFRQALILRAAALGINLPENDPSLTGTIEGTVVYRFKVGLVVIEMPVDGATVKLRGTDFKTTTNALGGFVFTQVPLGVYTVTALGRVLLVNRKGSATATLPTPPPSLDAERVFIVVR